MSMELLFAVLGGAIVGLLARYVLPGRSTTGVLLLPAIAVAVAAAVFAALTWLDWAFDGTWIWVVSLVAAGVAAFATGLVLPHRRQAADTRMLHALMRR